MKNIEIERDKEATIQMDIVVGIDIGGSKVRVGALDKQGDLLAMKETPIEAQQGPQAGLERIAGLIETVLNDNRVTRVSKQINLGGIGIGCTGPIDPLRGIVNNPYTLPTWENVPLRDWLSDRFGALVTLENDADVAALGEYWMGAGKGVKRLYAITVGTGIGTAVILNGEIYRGLDGYHPEGGHQVIDPNGPLCYCGSHGCWESLASGPAIAQSAQHMMKLLLEEEEALADAERDAERLRLKESALFAYQSEEIEARLIAELAKKGDPLARKIIEQAAYYFSLGIVNIIILFTPDMIVLSGGVMENAELFTPTLNKTLQGLEEIVPVKKVRIRQAQLGSYAGLYGAAYTILQRL